MPAWGHPAGHGATQLLCHVAGTPGRANAEPTAPAEPLNPPPLNPSLVAISSQILPPLGEIIQVVQRWAARRSSGPWGSPSGDVAMPEGL